MYTSVEASGCGAGAGGGAEYGELSEDAVRIVVAGARWERAAPPAAAAELEQRLFACGGPQHRLLPRLLHLLLTPADHSTPVSFIDSLFNRLPTEIGASRVV